MKKILISIVLLLILIVWVTPAFAITGGDKDGIKHPNVGAIVVVVDGKGREFCSGTLIHPRVFLTAGHCTDYLEFLIENDPNILLDDVKVSFSSENALTEGLLDVEEIISHPDYYWGPNSNPYDVGVLILVEEVTGITPATLPDEGFLDELKSEGKLREGSAGAKFTVVGYGGTLEWPPPEIIYDDNVRQVAKSEFLNLRKAWLHMSQNQAPGNGNGGTCFGDSGGPTFWTGGEDDILVAVTSWGDNVCVATGAAYRIDIPESLSFIDIVIGGL